MSPRQRPPKDSKGRVDCSPSKANKWLLCPRKWGYSYIDKLSEPSSMGAAIGTHGHKCVERWYANDTIKVIEALALAAPDSCGTGGGNTVRRCVRSLLASGQLPSREANLTAEKMLVIDNPDHHVRWWGFADLVNLGCAILAPIAGEADAWVYDHKFTSDLKYALTPDQLREDVQAIVYASWALQERPDLSRVGLQWTYTQRRGAATVRPVRVILTRAEVTDRMSMFDDVVGSMIKRASGSDIKSSNLPQNWDSCEAFGGCAFRDRCGQSPRSALWENFNVPKSDLTLLETLRATEKLVEETGGLAPAGAGQGAYTQLYDAAEDDTEKYPEITLSNSEEESCAQLYVAADEDAAKYVEEQHLGGSPTQIDMVDGPEHRYTIEKFCQAVSDDNPDQRSEVEFLAKGLRTVLGNRGPTLLVGVHFDGEHFSFSDVAAAAHKSVCDRHEVSDFRQIPYAKGVGDLAVAIVSGINDLDLGPGDVFVVDQAAARGPEWRECAIRVQSMFDDSGFGVIT